MLLKSRFFGVSSIAEGPPHNSSPLRQKGSQRLMDCTDSTHRLFFLPSNGHLDRGHRDEIVVPGRLSLQPALSSVCHTHFGSLTPPVHPRLHPNRKLPSRFQYYTLHKCPNWLADIHRTLCLSTPNRSPYTVPITSALTSNYICSCQVPFTHKETAARAHPFRLGNLQPTTLRYTFEGWFLCAARLTSRPCNNEDEQRKSHK